jgi:hypothetical protein
MEGLGLNRVIILKQILNNWDCGAWTGSIWLRIGTGAVNAVMNILVP